MTMKAISITHVSIKPERWCHPTGLGKFNFTREKQSIVQQGFKSEHGLTSPPTQYRLSGRQFYRSKDPTNSIKVLKKHKNTHKHKTQ